MLHKHIAKHAKRAHLHVQKHGHKWLWLLSGVFFFILIYPYFSNAEEPIDLCPNIDAVQESLPENYEVGENLDCICVEGFELDEQNNCIAIETIQTDLCPNIDGDQEVLPENYEVGENLDCICVEGFELDEQDMCVEIEEQTPTDLCPNIDEIQETIPQGQEIDENGECVPLQETGDETTEAIPLTGTITYSPTTNTTGTVTATLTGLSTTGVTITNNSGSNTYVFTESGSFTFTFENEQGATGEETATVDWIVPEPVLLTTQECEIQLQVPTSGALVSREFDINWSAGNCDEDEEITIQLRDHNGQWIDIGTGVLDDEEFVFQSTGLASTGFYTITGVHSSGSTRQETSGGVVIASGVYTQDTVYNLYTGAYIGAYTDFATGYQVRIVNSLQEELAVSDGTFTIDNQKPILTSLTGSFAPVVSGQIGRSGIMTTSFVSSEQLTGGTTFTILGTTVVPTTGSQSGNTYTYTVPLVSVVASGALVFTANIADLAGNTGSASATSTVVLKNHTPNIANLTLTEGASGSISLYWNTDVSTKHNFSYFKSGTTTITYFTGTQYGTAHNYTMIGLQNNNKYPFSILVSDNLSNSRGLSGVLHLSTTGLVSMTFPQSDIALYLSGQVETDLYLQILQNEINKFQACKATITFTNYTIPVGTKSVIIRKPAITDNTVNQIMGTFLVLFTNKIKEKTTLSQTELNGVADAINNFLVVMKLVDDENNFCEQKMSTYYLSQFEQLMSSMDFF